MSDYPSYTLAKQQMNERVQQAQRSRLPGQSRRHASRHAIAARLHGLADRIDG